jgi:hypothetical protein
MVSVKKVELVIHFDDGRVFNIDNDESLKGLSEEEQQMIENYLDMFE